MTGSEVTRVLSEAAGGDSDSASKLLPLVYDELRKLAAQRIAHEKPGQTLQATALVHEAFLRLVGNGDAERDTGKPDAKRWDGRGRFFAAAAEAMRRILIESARRRLSLKRGGSRAREFEVDDLVAPEEPEELLALDEALDRLAVGNPEAAELVKLRFFAGFTNAEAAALLGMSPRRANQVWAYARAWLREELDDDGRHPAR
jgi:RNA polymerase sigma factor (TIGR02999 family)